MIVGMISFSTNCCCRSLLIHKQHRISTIDNCADIDVDNKRMSISSNWAFENRISIGECWSFEIKWIVDGHFCVGVINERGLWASWSHRSTNGMGVKNGFE